MDLFFLGHEATFRSATFFGALGTVALWEVLAPRRVLTASKPVRWVGALTVSVLNTLPVRLVLPGLTVGMALVAGERGWGFLDLTTGLRFHPFESLVFNGINMALVAGLGLPVGAVILFEVLASAQSSLSHGNIRLPLATDRALRLVLVTPDMHRVHHSAVPQEADSNFGTLLPL